MPKKSLARLLFLLILAATVQSLTAGTSACATLDFPNLKGLLGEWVRPDGGYTIVVQDVQQTGSVTAAYFNPQPINVQEAKTSFENGRLKLFIKLMDKGYPGSTYTLYYSPQKDTLSGFYYHALLKQTFEVIFFKKPGQAPLQPEIRI